MYFLFWASASSPAIIGPGCTQQSTQASATTTTPTSQVTVSEQAGLANPASVNCGNIGGTSEIKKNADGSGTVCVPLQNGTTCEEWALFRGEGCQGRCIVNTTPTGAPSNQTGIRTRHRSTA